MSDDDKGSREASATEHPITEWALVWVSIHGPEPLIYTHKPRASKTAWADILLNGYTTRGYVQKRREQQSEKNKIKQTKKKKTKNILTPKIVRWLFFASLLDLTHCHTELQVTVSE